MSDQVIDNFEVDEILKKLESLEDENQAVELLREFNSASSEYGKLLINRDENLDHDEWKANFDQAKKRVKEIVNKIINL